MLIEVVALQPPHHYEGVVMIHLKKLLAGEPGEVNSVCSGGFTQEKTYYCAKCCKSFHGRCSMLCFTHARRAQGERSEAGCEGCSIKINQVFQVFQVLPM